MWPLIPDNKALSSLFYSAFLQPLAGGAPDAAVAQMVQKARRPIFLLFGV